MRIVRLAYEKMPSLGTCPLATKILPLHFTSVKEIVWCSIFVLESIIKYWSDLLPIIGQVGDHHISQPTSRDTKKSGIYIVKSIIKRIVTIVFWSRIKSSMISINLSFIFNWDLISNPCCSYHFLWVGSLAGIRTIKWLKHTGNLFNVWENNKSQRSHLSLTDFH